MDIGNTNTPKMMRGTIASETFLLGYAEMTSSSYRPVIAWGYGLVVGLDDSGSQDIPPALRAHILAQMQTGGIGSESAGWGHVNPEQMLDDDSTAVVVVEAIVPQGSVEGARFDVRVHADPRTGTTSLEGGTLYTTELRPRLPGATLPPLGGSEGFSIAKARGPIFINPFAEPGATNRDTINRTTGRILDGGRVSTDMPLKLRLVTPSHSRAQRLQSAINAQFPREPGQRVETARGEGASIIVLTVPPSYRDQEDDFVNLLLHTTIRRSATESIANGIRRAVVADPSNAMAASWRWEALGARAVPLIRDLYDFPEELPRMAALRAGARLNDGVVIDPLIAMTVDGSANSRIAAIELLRDFDLNPRIDKALRSLLDDPDPEIRLTAYEALAQRADPYLRRFSVDGKFVLDVVESQVPMIYITQVGQPRIVVFGPDLMIDQPITLQAWSNRLMLMGDGGDEFVEVYYREQDMPQGSIHNVEPRLEQFVQFLGHDPTIESPEPGLGFSYGETVGALHQIWRQSYIKADFKAEQDRILATILRARQDDEVLERPEFSEVIQEEEETSIGSEEEEISVGAAEDLSSPSDAQ